MKSMRQSCKCAREALCESISKIIHFAVATHFRLPLSITDVSGEGDGRPRCAARPLLFNLSSTPRRPPPSKLSGLHVPLHLFPYSLGSPQPSSAAACITARDAPPPSLLLLAWCVLCILSEVCTGCTGRHQKLRVLVCAKQTQIAS